MVTMQTQTSNSLSPATSSPLSVEPYYPMLKESIHHFLSQIEAGVSDFSHFNSVFFRLIQSIPSPPIEVIWFYSAVDFRTSKNTVAGHDELGKLLALKVLFRLLVSCSAPCCSLKRVASLAPLISELYNLVCEMKVKTTGFSLDQTIYREIDHLIEGILSFISICCCKGMDDHDDSLDVSPCFLDLIKVWTVGKCERDSDFGRHLGMFFPISSGVVRDGIKLGCGVGYIAGVVMWQSLFLNLCLKLGFEELANVSGEYLRALAVTTMNGFRSCYFFEVLLKMLLEPTLSATPLLSEVVLGKEEICAVYLLGHAHRADVVLLQTSTDEILLREALFDAVVTVEYPFFNPERGLRQCGYNWKALALTWLFVVNSALQYARQLGDHTKVTAYTKAFADSHIHCQLKSWFANQNSMEEDTTTSNFSTPSDFVEWLLDLRNQASSRGFGTETSDLLQKAVEYKARVECNFSFQNLDCQRNCENGFYVNVGTKESRFDGDLAMDEPTNGACFGHIANSGGRKRKEGTMNEDIRAKITKYHNCDCAVKNFILLQKDDDFINKNEMENSVRDEEMEIMAQ